ELTEPVAAAPTESVERNWTPAWIVGGVTVAALGTSFVFRGLANGKESDIDDLAPESPSACQAVTTGDCAALGDAIDQQKTYATVSNVTLIVGGVSAAATLGYITYALLKKEPKVRVSAAFDSTGGLFTL